MPKIDINIITKNNVNKCYRHDMLCYSGMELIMDLIIACHDFYFCQDFSL